MSNSIIFFTKVTTDHLKSIGLSVKNTDYENIFEISDDDGNSMGAVITDDGSVDYVMEKGDTYPILLKKILTEREESIISDRFAIELIYLNEKHDEDEKKLKGEYFDLLVFSTYDMIGFRKLSETEKSRMKELEDIITKKYFEKTEVQEDNETLTQAGSIEDFLNEIVKI